MELELEPKVGDLVFNPDAVDYPDGLFAVIMSVVKGGDWEDVWFDAEVMFDNRTESWTLHEIEWDEDLNAWYVTW
jgi:hypothetical protein